MMLGIGCLSEALWLAVDGAEVSSSLMTYLLPLAGVAVGAAVILIYFKALRKGAINESQRLVEDAKRDAEKIKVEAKLEINEEAKRIRDDLEKERKEFNEEIKEREKRLRRKEDDLERKAKLLIQNERSLIDKEKKIQSRQGRIERLETELQGKIDEEVQLLQKIAGISRDDAESRLMRKVEEETRREAAERIKKVQERLQEEQDKLTQDILSTAIQRCAVTYTSDSLVSTVDLPNDDMKGRIIGREGRNIRAIEKATGVDVIVDDTPGVIVVSCFDNVRREIARRSLEKLILDGRIHPARIEELVSQTKKEVDDDIRETGKKTLMDLNIHNVHNKIVNLLGRLKYRTSYGQNVLKHSIEVAYLANALAGELRVSTKLAMRCGLLHDIGKALDHEMEGGHPGIGADVARRCGERKEVINAIASHHEDTPAESIFAVIAQVADAISAARPGARRETMEKYIKRLERLESVAQDFQGVDHAYAIQAGREVRVIVDADNVDDDNTVHICREIAKKIEEELSYPGEVRVTLIREKRVVDYAR
jgi:ribonuclease Y